ncbi:MAG: DUF4833 domain-containing protein [Polyangiaceae bacterium]
MGSLQLVKTREGAVLAAKPVAPSRLVKLIIWRARWIALAAVLLPGVSTAVASKSTPSSTVAPLFLITKSQNKNQVQYAIRLDDHCSPASAAPVFAYWRMLEQGPARTAPLLSSELHAYGLASQRIVARKGERNAVSLTLRAVPSRPILVETSVGPHGACAARATITIALQPARLFNVYARLSWFLGVDYLLLQGWSIDGKRVIKERLNP